MLGGGPFRDVDCILRSGLLFANQRKAYALSLGYGSPYPAIGQIDAVPFVDAIEGYLGQRRVRWVLIGGRGVTLISLMRLQVFFRVLPLPMNICIYI